MRYFRQALALIREEKLYSAMYIAGTALAVAFVMLIAEVYYVKVADIAPEVHRSTTYYLPNLEIKNSDGSEMKGIMAARMVRCVHSLFQILIMNYKSENRKIPGLTSFHTFSVISELCSETDESDDTLFTPAALKKDTEVL